MNAPELPEGLIYKLKANYAHIDAARFEELGGAFKKRVST